MDKKESEKNILDLEYKKQLQILNVLLIFGSTGVLAFVGTFLWSPKNVVLGGFLVCLIAAVIQFIADRQMAIFRNNKANNGQCINTGLWKYSRHPNYLGEISLWWGMWIMLMGSAPQYWITVIGPVAMTILFIFISIPMMEKYVLQKRPMYADYKKTVPMLIPRLKTPR